MTLPSRTPSDHLYRIGRDVDTWAWPDWLFAGDDGTFGNRWDDPIRKYRVLYACSQRLGAFVETLARFRPDPHVVAGLDAIVDDEPDEGALRPGQVHTSWVWARRIGSKLRRSAPRGVTQEISRYVLEQVDSGGTQAFDGICYLSRLGDDFTNWVIFEPDDLPTWKLIADATRENFDADDDDLERALKILNLQLVGS